MKQKMICEARYIKSIVCPRDKCGCKYTGTNKCSGCAFAKLITLNNLKN